MDERERARDDRLPEASERFTQAILDGADDIRRYERRRRRAQVALLIAAAAALVAVGLGAALSRLGRPKPDTVVTAVNPDRVPAMTSAPTSVPTLTPEPEEAGADDDGAERTREDPATGLVTLTDAGPFEPGEWVCVTNGLGELDYGLIVRFRDRPSASARAVETVVGMQVQYLGDAGNGFSHVRFAGIDGYIESASLRRPPVPATADPGEDLAIAQAMLYITDSAGEIAVEFFTDTLSCYVLQKLLDSAKTAREGEYADAPLGALLVVFMRDPDAFETREGDAEKWARVVRYAVSCDGTGLFQAEDGARRIVYESDMRLFWSLFPDIRARTWRP